MNQKLPINLIQEDCSLRFMQRKNISIEHLDKLVSLQDHKMTDLSICGTLKVAYLPLSPSSSRSNKIRIGLRICGSC